MTFAVDWDVKHQFKETKNVLILFGVVVTILHIRKHAISFATYGVTEGFRPGLTRTYGVPFYYKIPIF